MADPVVPVFDGHNDTLLRLVLRKGTSKERSFFTEADFDHIDLPRAWRGGFAGGFFAMFTPSRANPGASDKYDRNDPANFSGLNQEKALAMTLQMAGLAHEMARRHPNAVMVPKNAADIRRCVDGWAGQEGRKHGPVAMLLHIEGAEAIDADFRNLEVLYAAGLRSIGPVWSRGNVFAEGVPMAFPAGPDIGNGLTDAGKALVSACNDLGVMIDLSHLNEKGFWDVAKISSRPLVATHSNAHVLCQYARNLTDKQLDAVAESGGVVGINFHVAFLREDGKFNSDTPLETIVRHADHLLSRLGEDGVALGSDFDGCMLPRDMGDVTGLPALINAFRAAGYGEALIAKICHRNWISVLERTIG